MQLYCICKDWERDLSHATLRAVNCSMQPDQERYLLALVRLCQRGETSAFGEIYDILVDDLYRYVYSKVRDVDREDVCSDVFLKVWENIGRYEAQKNVSFRSWFFTVARNVVIDHYRKRRDTLEIDEALQVADISVESSPSRGVNQELDREYLLSLLGRLKEEYRQAVTLKYLNECSNAEIAQIMGKSETAIRILVHRGLKQLHEMVGGPEASSQDPPALGI